MNRQADAQGARSEKGYEWTDIDGDFFNGDDDEEQKDYRRQGAGEEAGKGNIDIPLGADPENYFRQRGPKEKTEGKDDHRCDELRGNGDYRLSKVFNE